MSPQSVFLHEFLACAGIALALGLYLWASARLIERRRGGLGRWE
jgi:hypothetical protein